MEGIFISYRRDDSAGYAGRLYDRLESHFGAERVFMDVEGIEPGTDFVHAIEKAVASCKVLIVIIGDEWINATDSTGRRRLEDPNDFIRIETATALQRDIRVVPVLVDQAQMPAVTELPEDLQALVRRQAVELNHKQWEATSGELIHTLEKILDVRMEGDPPPGGPPTQGPGNRWWLAAAALVMVAAIGLWAVIQTSPKPPEATTQDAQPSQSPAASSVQPERPPPPSVPVMAEQAPEPAAAATTTEPPAGATAQTPPTPPPADPAGKEAATQDDPPVPPQPQPVERAQGSPGQPQPATPSPPDTPVAERPPEPPIAPPPDPPKITRLTSRALPEGAEICYQASGATQLTLLPGPGGLPDSRRGCVRVPLQASTRLTLTALGDGGSSEEKVTAAPLPKPEIAVAPPAPPAPPVISSLRALRKSDQLTLCYRVSGATLITLSPAPGRLEKSRDCVPITPSAATRYTLEAKGTGGSVRRSLTVQPIPAKPEPQVSSRLPGKGESWLYRMRGKWPTSPKRLIRLQVDRSDRQQVAETMHLLKPNRRTGGSRSSGDQPVILSWPGFGFEFSPWLGSYLEPGKRYEWGGIATPTLDEWGNWKSSAKSIGQEQVSVEAGRFDSWKVEVQSNRFATGGATLAGLEPVRVELIVWYAPTAKRYVKSVRRIFSAEGRLIEEDHMELVRFGIE